MTHSYITLAALKSAGALNITGTANDDRLLALAEAASDVIDRWCNRHFYALKATLRFDGDGGATIGVPDLVSVDSVRTYDRNGAVTVWGAGDYELLPYNAAPAPAGNANSRPYTRLLATGAGDRACFPLVRGNARGNVEVSGVWGWQQRLRRATETANAVSDGAATSVALNAHSDVLAGHTLLIGNEQLYVRARVRNTLTVERGVNGTTPAPIVAKSAIDIYEYPPAVSEAALLLAIRMWQGARGGVDDWQAGDVGMDADIGLLLSAYRKPALGVF